MMSGDFDRSRRRRVRLVLMVTAVILLLLCCTWLARLAAIATVQYPN